MRLPVVVVLICYLILLLTDWIIIRDLRVMSLYDKFKPVSKKRRRWWVAYLVFSILVLALLTVAVCMPKKSSELDVTAVMWMLYTVMTVEFAQIVYSVFSLLGFIPCVFRGRRWNLGLWVGLPLAALVFTMMWWGATVGRNSIQVERVEVSSPRLPESFNGYRIAQISDLHVGTWGEDTHFIDRLVDSVNNLKPDLIVFTGDAVNRESSEFVPFIKSLSRLKAPDGVFSVLGNHDYGDYISWNSPKQKKANLDSLKAYQKKAGWKLLDNGHVAIRNKKGDSIVLIGVGNWGEPPFSRYGDLFAAYPDGKHNDDNFKILLSHNPEHWNREVSRKSNIDLTLSGHTHAMQIMLSIGSWKWSPAKYRYDQWGGLYGRNNDNGEKTNVYVNIGAGEVGIPMRLGATPEITLITLGN